MKTPKIFESEYRFCLILWEHEPVNSTKLVELCKNQLDWSKATTYTVIRRLCEKGMIQNENSIVTALISKDHFLAEQSDRFIEENFGGSLPMFLAAFSRCNELSEEDLAYMRAILREKEGK